MKPMFGNCDTAALCGDRELDRLTERVAVFIEEACQNAYLLTCGKKTVEAILDDIGISRRLHGYNTLVAGVKETLLGKLKSGADGYTRVRDALAVQLDASPRWIEKQMQYALDDAKKGGRLLRFNAYVNGFSDRPQKRDVVRQHDRITPAEFLAEFAYLLIRQAIAQSLERSE